MRDSESRFWLTRPGPVTRRQLLRGSAVAGLGLAAAALIGCGDDDDDDDGAAATAAATAAPATAAATQTGQTISTATAAPATPAAAGVKRGGRFQYYSARQAPNLDPTLSISYQTHHRISLIYSNLVELLQGPAGIYDTAIAPDLAETWENTPDRLTWTFNLRQGVKWANVAPMNGRPLETEDVVFSFERNLLPEAVNRARYNMLDGLPTAPDDSTIVFNLLYPHPGFLFNLGSEPSEIQPPDAVEQEGDLKNWGAGTGPFIMTRYEPAETAEYDKNPDYYDAENVYLDGVDTLVVPDKATAIANFRSGNLDMLGNGNGMHALRPSDRDAIAETDPDAIITPYLGIGQSALAIRFEAEGFTDVRVRQAVNHALNRNAYLAALSEGAGVFTGTFPFHRFPDFALPQAELLNLLRYDVAEAKKLVAAAGVEDGFTAKIAWLSPSHEAVVNIHVEMLKEIGIGLDTGAEILDYTGWVSKTFTGQYSQFAAWGYGVGSIWDYVVGLHHTEGNRNGPAQSYPAIDAKIDTMLRSGDEEEQIQLVQEIERFALTEGLWNLPLYSGQAYLIEQPWVKNFNPSFGAKGGVYLSNHVRHVWLDK